MSDTENQNNVVEPAQEAPAASSASATASSLLTNLLALKESNPKVFFGGIGGVVVLLIIAISSGGDSGVVKPPLGDAGNKVISIGQKYTLQSPNSYEPDATIKLVPVPGTIAAYDDSEEEDNPSACRRIKQGTPVTVTALSDAYGKKDAFAQVKIEDGDCKGKDGWALTIDLK
jgi:hypothetical protein